MDNRHDPRAFKLRRRPSEEGIRKFEINWKWYNIEHGLSCDQCIKAQLEAEDTRDCGICPKPTISPDNIVPYQMYQMVANQWIVAGMGEPIALNYSTVLSVLSLYIKDENDLIDTFEKIVYLSNLDLKLMQEKTKKK